MLTEAGGERPSDTSSLTNGREVVLPETVLTMKSWVLLGSRAANTSL